MNLLEAVKIAQLNAKRIKRSTWINFLTVEEVLSKVKKSEDVLAEDYLIEDDIATISKTKLKEALSFLSTEDIQKVLDRVGLR